MMMEASERELVIEKAGSAQAFARALAALSDVDLIRLRAIARLRARGLPPDVSWADLLHEAIARSLDGSRQWPAAVPLLAFLSGVMRSLCDEFWRERARESELIRFGDGRAPIEIACPTPGQERVFAAIEAVKAIYALFAGDRLALQIVAGLAAGQTAEEIRQSHALSPVAYDSARRRMRRALLRAGLAWTDP